MSPLPAQVKGSAADMHSAAKVWTRLASVEGERANWKEEE